MSDKEKVMSMLGDVVDSDFFSLFYLEETGSETGWSEHLIQISTNVEGCARKHTQHILQILVFRGGVELIVDESGTPAKLNMENILNYLYWQMVEEHGSLPSS